MQLQEPAGNRVEGVCRKLPNSETWETECGLENKKETWDVLSLDGQDGGKIRDRDAKRCWEHNGANFW